MNNITLDDMIAARDAASIVVVLVSALIGRRDMYMTIEEIISKKKELGYSTELLSKLSGVPVGTLQKILSGRTKAPRYETRKALEDVLWPKESYYFHDSGYVEPDDTLMFRDTSSAYYAVPEKEQGAYTIEDYIAWPEDERIELIDGYIYKMLAPTYIHQRFAFYFAHLVQNYIEKNHGKCIPLVSPLDVQLDCDNKTMIQPDAVIICDRSKITEARIVGAPDFVLEVLSKSTRKKDLSLKMKKYLNAGVREYWILDPRDKRLYVYDFRDEGIPGVYPLEGEVGIRIFDEELKIPLDKFAAMFDEIGDR